MVTTSLLAGIDSAAPAVAVWDGAEIVLGGRVDVRVVYLDDFSGGRAEVALAHSRGAAVVLCANSTTTGLVAGTLEDGIRYGEAQAVLARDLGAPDGALVFVDIEAMDAPTPEWIAGWCYGLRGLRPGVYADLRAAPSVNALLAAHLRYAAVRADLALWSATPRLVWTGGPLPAWRADHLAGFATYGWQAFGNVVVQGGSVDVDLWQPSTPGLWRALDAAAKPPSAAAAKPPSAPPADIFGALTYLEQAMHYVSLAEHALHHP